MGDEMEPEELSLKARCLLRKAGLSNVPRPALVGICILGLAVICAGAWQFWPRPNDSFAISTASTAREATHDETAEESTEESTPAEIVVDVEGSVNVPGLYTLAGDARIGDAVDSAGGFANDAAKGSVNLAQKLSDGEQVYVPSINDMASPNADASSSASAASALSAASGKDDGKININTASAEELQKLSGIGPSLSERIIDYREANGKFKSTDELKNVSGIGDTRFDNLKDKICI